MRSLFFFLDAIHVEWVPPGKSLLDSLKRVVSLVLKPDLKKKKKNNERKEGGKKKAKVNSSP
jgi:hypothetical protein